MANETLAIDSSERSPDNRWPSKQLRVGLAVWALVVGLSSGFADPPLKSTLFHLAAWPPVLAMFIPLLRKGIRTPWRLLALGVTFLLLASTTESVERYKGLAIPDHASVSDLIFISGYLLLGAGVWMLVARHARRSLADGIVDALVMMVPAVVLVLEYIIVPASDAGDSWTLRLLAALYPLADVVLLAALLWLIATPSLGKAHLGALIAGVTLTLIADVMLAADLLDPDTTGRAAVEGIYPLTYALMAVGIARGATTRLGVPHRAAFVHWGRVVLLAFGAILGPISVAVAAVGPNPLPTTAVAIAAVLSASLIVYRMLDLALKLEAATEELESARSDLQIRAVHDPLTGLLNRAVLRQLVEDLASPESRPAALLSIDLDAFKAVNDDFGHAAGDVVLTTVAERMRQVLRPSDRIMRVGGDEFLVVLSRVGTREVEGLAARVIAAIERSIEWKDHQLEISASIGIAILNPRDPVKSIEPILAEADEAMYSAKQAGSGLVRTNIPGD